MQPTNEVDVFIVEHLGFVTLQSYISLSLCVTRWVELSPLMNSKETINNLRDQ